MDDPEMEQLAASEAMDRLALVSELAQRNLERLARSLNELADVLDDLSEARQPQPGSAEDRRAAFRREECQGRFPAV